MGVSNHFIRRAVERMRCDEAHAARVGEGLLWAVEHDRRDIIEFVARTTRDGCRLFRFRHAPSARYWFALINTESMTCITVMPPGFVVRRDGKAKIILKEDMW